jgi:Fe-S-cluster formation regulator IscX/YfhJ
MSNLMKIYPGAAYLFHAHRQPETIRFTDMMKLTVAFCNFVNAHRKKNLGKKTIKG